MAIINKMYLKDANGVETPYDIGASANNVAYDNNTSIKSKVDSVNSTLGTHTSTTVIGSTGVHDIRYYQNKLQVKNGTWIDVTGSGDGKVVDVIGPKASPSGQNVGFNLSDSNDSRLKNTYLVRKTGSAPGENFDPNNYDTSTLTIVGYTSAKDNYASTNTLSDNNLTYGTIYYYRFYTGLDTTGSGSADTLVPGTSIMVKLAVDILEIAKGGTGNADGYIRTGQLAGSTIGDNATAEGRYTVARGLGSHAEGLNTSALSQSSHAEGVRTYAGQDSHSEGSDTYAIGPLAHSEGVGTTANAKYAHSEGHLTIATTASHAEGEQTRAIGEACHAEGYKTSASGKYAHAEGENTTADGAGSHAEGSNTSARYGAHAEGSSTCAWGSDSHAEGLWTTASGACSHAEGYNTYAAGRYSHVEGNQTYALEDYAHAEGYQTTANGKYSHAEGYGTLADYDYAHASGKYTEAFSYGNFTHGVGKGSDQRLGQQVALGNIIFGNESVSKFSELANFPHGAGFAYGINIEPTNRTTAGTSTGNGKYGYCGTIYNNGVQLDFSLETQGMYLLFISSYTVSTGKFYSGGAYLLIAGDCSGYDYSVTDNIVSIPLGSSGTVNTISINGSSISVKKLGSSYATQVSLIRVA